MGRSTQDNDTSELSEARRLRLLVDNIVDYAIYMLDENGIVSSWNAGAQRFKGYTRDEIIGRHFSTFFPEEARRAGRPAELLALARTAGRAEDEGWRVRKDGTRFWALAVIDAIHDETGKFVGFAEVTRDVTERRAAEMRLLESERIFHLLVRGVTDYAIFMLNPEGIISSWNSGAERIKGYTEAEIVGQHFSRFYLREDVESGVPVRALETARSSGKFEAEGWRVRKDGTRFWASVVIEPMLDDHGKLIGFAKITRDMTERRRANLDLERARNQLFHSQKLEALGQMTGGVAHDFNNLIAVILSGATMMKKQVKGNERAQWILGEIHQAATRGAELTKQMLAFSRLQPMQVETVDVGERLQQVEKLLRLSLRGDIRVVLDVPAGISHIAADPGQLELALLNVGLNARDAMPEGGTLTITARNVTIADGQAGLRNGNYVAVSAADTGVGISPEHLPMVFDPFFTTKEVGKGTGLGLSQAYGFARQMGGSVQIESEIGKGAVVTFYLPVATAGKATAAVNHEAAAPTGPHQGTILLVEDTPQLARLAEAYFVDVGYNVRHAANAAEALALLRNSTPIDIVLSDIILPGEINGVELAKRLRVELPALPVVLTTGFSTAVKDIPDGIPLVMKPYDLDRVADLLARILREQGAARATPGW